MKGKTRESGAKGSFFEDIVTKVVLAAVAAREIAETYFRVRNLINQTRHETVREAEKDRKLQQQVEVSSTFKDIIGFEKTKEELMSALKWPLRHSELMREYDVEPINGVCLFGPPGCGKTHFVRCAAGEFRAKLYLATPSNIGSMWYGQTERRIRRLFEEARRNSPSILAIDEADKILPKSSGSSVHPRMVSEFLQNMDGLLSEKCSTVVVLVTNEPWRLHEAVVRRGRVDRMIYVPPPDYETRVALFRFYTSKVHDRLDGQVSFEELGKLTEPSERGYYSSAAIREVCRTAKEEAFKSALSSGAAEKISMLHFQSALLRVPPDIERGVVSRYEEWAARHASREPL